MPQEDFSENTSQCKPFLIDLLSLLMGLLSLLQSEGCGARKDGSAAEQG